MNVAGVLESSSASVLSESSSSGVVLDSLPQHFPRVEGTGFCGVPVASKKNSSVAPLCHQKCQSLSSACHTYLVHVPLELGTAESLSLLAGVVGGVVGGGGHERSR